MADRRVLNSWSQIGRALSGRLARGDVRCVSFDVFDTLVKRRCHPEMILHGVAVALHQALDDSPGVEAILQARHTAYAELARRSVDGGRDPETNLHDISLAWVERLVPDAGTSLRHRLAALARDSERRFELWTCIPNRALLRLCRELREAGHRLVYVSDMYLGGELVAEILEHCGFGGLFDAGYVSADHVALKRTGTLFARVAAAEDLPAASILHVGDDRLADGDQASAAGWSAIVVRDRDDVRRRRRDQFDLHRLRTDPSWSGVVAGEFLAADDGHAQDTAYHFGRHLIGPQLAAMTQHLVDYARAHAIDRVYFLSREGLVLRAMYQEYVEALGIEAPSADYLCVSRISSCYGAMGDYYGLREVGSAALANANKSVRRLLAPLKFDARELATLAAQCGVSDLDAPANFHDSPAFARLVSHPRVSARTREVAGEGRRALRDYLRGRGFYAVERVAVVDVGWGAQIQENLALAVEDEVDAPQIHGVYLGTNRYAAERRAGGLRVDASLADETVYDWAAGAAFDFVQLYEISTRAPHGTVLGYRDAEPVLAESGTPQRDSEDAEDAGVARAQRGMIDAARLYARCVAMTGAGTADTRRYVANLACRVNRFPRREEVEFFLRFRNVSNFGTAETLTLGETLPWWRPLHTAKAVNRALWSEGVARLSFGPLGAMTMAVLKAARTRRRLPRQQDARLAAAAVPADTGTRSAQAVNPPHAFEAAMLEHWRGLMHADPQAASRDRPALGAAVAWRDLVLITLTHRLANLYLRTRGLPVMAADLLPLGPFTQRALFRVFGDQLLYLRRRWRRLRGR